MTSLKEKVSTKFSNKVIRVSQVISATVAIIGTVTALFAWLDQRFVDKVSGQINALHDEMVESDEKNGSTNHAARTYESYSKSADQQGRG